VYGFGGAVKVAEREETHAKREGSMTAEHSEHPRFKQKAAHEFIEIGIVFAYLAFVFCSLATYSMLLLERF
jgi:hypothetical protein